MYWQASAVVYCLRKRNRSLPAYKLTLLQKKLTCGVFCNLISNNCNLISNNWNNKSSEHRRGRLDEGIREQELFVLKGKAKYILLEIDYITAEYGCVWVCVHAYKLLLKAPTHFLTLSIILHFLLCVSIQHQMSEMPAMSFSPSNMSSHHNLFFTLLSLLFSPCISFNSSSVSPSLSSSPFVSLTLHLSFCWSISIGFGTWQVG